MRTGTIILLLTLLVPSGQVSDLTGNEELRKSPFYAYVGREFIFTIEVVEPGVPILNFVSMADKDEKLLAKNVRLALGNRRVAAKLFLIEADRYQEPMYVSSIQMHPRSSFGFRVSGSFGKSDELYGAEIRLGQYTFALVPLSKFEFETLVRKVNRVNLGSPDFRDDYRVLNLELLGSRSSTRR